MNTDTVMRKDVHDAFDKLYQAARLSKKCIHDVIDEVPAAPHEMTAREFLEILKRQAIVEQREVHIQFYPTSYTLGDFNAWIAQVEQWAKEHPEKRKTYAEDFKEKFPKVRDLDFKGRKGAGLPNLCKAIVYGLPMNCRVDGDCTACWNEQLEDENGCGSGKN